MDQISPIDQVNKISNSKKKTFYKELLSWFSTNKREFPWRNTNDPYKILISELLLQKTNSRAVSNIYIKFIKTFPTIEDVSNSDVEIIKDIISSLGLFYRAERIMYVCQNISQNYSGSVPNALDSLIGIKGIGRYAASAVLSFGFDKNVAILDRNVIRVLERVFGIKSKKNRPHTDKDLWKSAQLMLPPKKSKTYNFAILDFSAKVCRPKPHCTQCPIESICIYDSKNHDN